MNIGEELKRLREEKLRINSEMRRIDREINKLQSECIHEEAGYMNVKVLTPRWAYEEVYSYDNTGEREIETRYRSCDCCRKGWTEMRYTDSEWLESVEWNRRARKREL